MGESDRCEVSSKHETWCSPRHAAAVPRPSPGGHVPMDAGACALLCCGAFRGIQNIPLRLQILCRFSESHRECYGNCNVWTPNFIRAVAAADGQKYISNSLKTGSKKWVLPVLLILLFFYMSLLCLLNKIIMKERLANNSLGCAEAAVLLHGLPGESMIIQYKPPSLWSKELNFVVFQVWGFSDGELVGVI